MNIKELTIEQLKALAYDQILILEKSKHAIAAIQQELESRNTESSVIKSED